jgi:membrane-associated phospholipid phosphatase
LSRRGRRPALVIIAVSVVVFVGLAIWVRGRRYVPIDYRVTVWVYEHVRSVGLIRALTDLTSPGFETGVLVTAAVAAAGCRRWRVAVLAVLGPLIAVFASEGVFKPLIGRPRGGSSYPTADSFPSGHETGLTAMLVVLSVLLLRTTWHAAVKAAVLLIFAAWAALGAVGLVRIFAHYPSDTVGALCVSLAVVLSTALLIDVVADRRVSGPAVPDPPRTASAA